MYAALRRALLFALNLAAAALVAAAVPRHLTPAGREWLQQAESTVWRRELDAAAEVVARRRRQRRLLRRQTNEISSDKQQRQRALQKYNDYLPADADASLVELASSAATTTATKCLSPLQKFFVEMIESIGLDAWHAIEAHNVTSLAYLYKHHVAGSDGNGEYFGTYGERSTEMKGNHAALREFWAGAGAEGGGEGAGNVVLLGMHGVDLADDDKLIPTLQQMYGLDGGEAFKLGRKIQTIVESLPGAFNNPVLTTNAMAIQSLNPDGSASERDSIIVGDGVFAFLEWLDLRNDGPAYIHAHEFGHHLQYEAGVKAVGSGWTKAEETRRWEMMADALGAYYLSHAQGGRMDARQLLDVHRAAFSMGDCEDAVGSHHGTPRQRECASHYGASVALDSWRDGGRVVSAAQLQRLFDVHYAKILSLEAEQCAAAMSTNLLDHVIYGDAAGTGNGGGVAMDIPEDLETPWDASEFGWYTPQAENSAPFEAYDPEEHAQPANELDEPPPRVQNDAYEEEEVGWFDQLGSQWDSGRTVASSGRGRVGSGCALLVAAIASASLAGMLA
ncbi:hypothetical protein ACHAXT_010940 [Thalassiosira profunda]